MAFKINALSTAVLRNIGHKGNTVEGADVGAIATVKKNIGGLDYTLKLAQEQKNNTHLHGGAITVGKKFNELNVTAATDLVSREVTLTGTLVPDPRVELKAITTVRKKKLVVDTTFKPSAAHKLVAQWNPTDGLAAASYTFAHEGLEVTPLYVLPKRAATLTAVKKTAQGTFTAQYAFSEQVATVSWLRKPFKVVARSSLGQSGWGPASASLMLDLDFEVVPPPKRAPQLADPVQRGFFNPKKQNELEAPPPSTTWQFKRV